jgi:hypothetical protein
VSGSTRHLSYWKQGLGQARAAIWAHVGLQSLKKLDLRWVTTLDPPPWLGALEARGCLVCL